MINEFGELLRELRIKKGVTRASLASRLNVSPNTIASWERNISIPDEHTVGQIGSLLGLAEGQVSLLLIAGNYKSSEDCSIHNGLLSESIADSITPIRTQMLDVINVLDQTPNEGVILPEVMNTITSDVANVQSNLQQLTVDVAVPPREKMTVKMVPISEIQRLEEYRNEENIWFSVAFLFFGAILGIPINLVTGGSISASSWIVGSVLLLMVLLSMYSAIKNKRNADIQISRIRNYYNE